jgi:oxygen-independent coproporphyrinogen-3 oxidase
MSKTLLVRAGIGCVMDKTSLKDLGFFDARIPRYTSYPPASVFSAQYGATFQENCIRQLNPHDPVSVYVHIPFCERLCWFCACRTQGTKTLGPVESYLQTVKAELNLLRDKLPKGVRMGRLHWGGGTPTILLPDMIRQLAQDIFSVIPPSENLEFSVEIDPTMVDAAKINSLADIGMTRASIGIQDFAPEVQDAIGRHQSFAQTKECVDLLRSAGITSLNADLVYGLPHQTSKKIATSLEKVLQLKPDRIALFGYAHVPHMSKRQKLIKSKTLPDDMARLVLSELATTRLVDAGYEAIGIDHFAKPDDGLAGAMLAGTLRRNFQGYTEDTCQTLIGIGASSISRFQQGYVQNASATAAYIQRISAGSLAAYRGHEHSPEDMLRARVIEMIMCDYAIDFAALRNEFGTMVDSLESVNDAVCKRFGNIIQRSEDSLGIGTDGRLIARLVANVYDDFQASGTAYSRAS